VVEAYSDKGYASGRSAPGLSAPRSWWRLGGGGSGAARWVARGRIEGVGDRQSVVGLL